MSAGAAAQIEARIHDLSHDGRGVADIDGRRIFVAGALPDEHVLVAPRRRKRRFEEAELVRVMDASAARVEPACEYFGTCGGCALQHLARAAQLEFKQGVAAQAFTRIAGVEPDEWLAPVAGPEWHYRRRARLGVKYVPGKQRVLVGFRERAAPYVTDMTHCPVLVPPLDGSIGELAQVIGGTGIKSRLPQVEAAMGDDTGAIVLRVLDPPGERDVAAFAEFGARHDLDVYLQPGGPGTAYALGEPRRLAYRLDAFDVRLEFLPTDFIQVNAHINARMVETAVEAAGVGPADRVLDLFCGLGNFSLPMSRRAGEVLGVEGEAGLVARAASNARLNEIGNARFVTADLTQTELGFLRESWDVAVLDPPRTGAQAIVEQMRKLGPRRIVYVSCHPATLARDAEVLVKSQGYRLSSARIFDMFPHTHHVEVMACFDRKS